jgi:hypothetical protein
METHSLVLKWLSIWRGDRAGDLAAALVPGLFKMI